ncbi:MAG: hypothetical protein AMK73_06155, partial [Planctomycetes bacterium SM23_32]
MQDQSDQREFSVQRCGGLGAAMNAGGFPRGRGLYDPRQDHDGCGVGFVARLDGVPYHSVVRDAVQVLVNLEHRGAVGGDKATGDGAGLLLQIPDRLLRRECGGRGLELP